MTYEEYTDFINHMLCQYMSDVWLDVFKCSTLDAMTVIE